MRGTHIGLILIAVFLVSACSATRDQGYFRFRSPILNRFADAEQLYERYTVHKSRFQRVKRHNRRRSVRLRRKMRSSKRRAVARLKPIHRRRRLVASYLPTRDRLSSDTGELSKRMRRYLRRGEDVEARRRRIVETARSYIKARQLWYKGRRYPMNCVDFVRMVYTADDINLKRWPGMNGHGWGVRSLVKLSRKAHAMHYNPRPKKGDLVFFHHTYDYTRDGRINDWFSHIGIVEKVDTDGTVHFINRYGRSIHRSQVNILRPSQWRDRRSRKRLNSYMRARRRRDPRGTRYLAGELFAGFATLIK